MNALSPIKVCIREGNEGKLVRAFLCKLDEEPREEQQPILTISATVLKLHPEVFERFKQLCCLICDEVVKEVTGRTPVPGSHQEFKPGDMN